jgi:hypothetical protein
MTTRTGTGYFTSFDKACEYHSPYGYNQEDIRRKIADGDISIGEPKYGNNPKADADGRYWIEIAFKATPREDSDTIESISYMIASGNRLELPKETHFHNYTSVKRVLETAGGNYSKNGFTFEEDAAEIQKRICNGELINDKKKFQFFETPQELSVKLCEMAGIESHNSVCEPSAGKGAILRLLPDGTKAVELMSKNAAHLLETKVINKENLFQLDFLECTPENLGTFDRFVANPPFTKNQDIDHVRHMYSLLNDGGRIVSVASTSWINGSQKKQQQFVEWLDEVGGHYELIEAGAFKESGTNIQTSIITINKN